MPNDITEVLAADAALGALADPTLSDVWREMHGHGAEVVAAVAAQRALAGSLPEEWTIGEDGDLAITQSGIAGEALRLRSSGAAENDRDVLIVEESGGEAVLRVGSSGRLELYFYTPSAVAEFLAIDPRDVDYLHAVDSVGAHVFAVDKSGNPVLFGTHTAPADGDLVAGDCALWFDQTNGAAKLKIKGKSADGTVVQGEVALA